MTKSDVILMQENSENISIDDNINIDTLQHEVESTNAPAKSIKAIDKSTVHRICSGQVVLTVATAVKELVENSIDAGATTVEIRLIENGSSLIEVSDNGRGVEPCDFEGLTLKHHTSKLQDFGDLIGVKTFGFRGEALSSLCALSDLMIITRHSNQSVGTKLIYNTNGQLTEKLPMSRQIGTTVSLQNLFYTLPVRHKEFLRNLKKEFNKMIQVLYSYCLITTDVRIMCTNVSGKNKTTIVSTESHSSMKENISSIFGHKQVANLLEIQQKSPNEDILTEYGVTEKFNKEIFEMKGFISSCEHGKGRSAADRQFYFINNRPCDPSKVMRVVNETYHHYNKHQFPMVALNIVMEEGDVDVNVTPDKRQIMISRERLLLATIKTTLINLYESVPSTLKLQNFTLPTNSSPRFASMSSPSTPNSTTKLSDLTQRFSRTNSPFSSVSSSQSGGKKISSYGGIKRSLSVQSDFQTANKQPKLQDFSFQMNTKSNSVDVESSSLSLPSNAKDNLDNSFMKDFEILENDWEKNEELSEDCCAEMVSVNEDRSTTTPKNVSKEIHSTTDAFLSSLRARKKTLNLSKNANDDEEINTEINNLESIREETNLSYIDKRLSPRIIYDDITNGFTSKSNQKSKTKIVDFSVESLREKLFNRKKLKKNGDENVFRKFRAQISPMDNNTAEEELKREISKDSFTRMQLLGQFNLGFMITRLHSDIFIIDQHATDEKYNFETLQKTCVLQNQKLIIPQTMELTAANEGILIDNLDIFTKNGFEFKIDDTKEVGRRVVLTSMPHSKGWEFKKEDIEEMIFMLSDSPGVMCRPSRINAMFASRACRKSVMIGTHLNNSQMRKLVDHMSELEQPWNCPHGRPTIRHLINLDVLTKLK